jgi:arylsulfatase A-like enzyme
MICDRLIWGDGYWGIVGSVARVFGGRFDVKNIILIITDTFRYDNLGQRAALPVRTPALDRFAARRATSIERFYTGSFPTIPHRTDLAQGVLGWPHYGWQPIDQSGPNHIANLLRQAGYATQLVCDCPHLFNARFQHAFDAAFQHRGQEGDRPLLHLNDPILNAMPPQKTRGRPTFMGHTLVDVHRWTNRNPRYETETFPARTGATAIRWLEENSSARPFFLWVDFFDPHEPWDAPEYLVRRYNPGYDGPPMVHPNYGPASDYTASELRNLRAHYAAEAELVDRWIGRILEKVEDLELWSDSIVVVTTDHGMSLGEHARTGKSNIHDGDPRFWPIYPEIGHVPFLIAGGDVPQGDSLELIAQPIDILPTLSDLAGVALDPPTPFEGASFADAVLGGTFHHRAFAVSGCHVDPSGSEPPRRAVTPFLVKGHWGYAPVGALGRPELYDLSVDPLAERDVAPAHPDVVDELQRDLLTHLEDHAAAGSVLELWRSAGSLSGADVGIWAVDYPTHTV